MRFYYTAPLCQAGCPHAPHPLHPGGCNVFIPGLVVPAYSALKTECLVSSAVDLGTPTGWAALEGKVEAYVEYHRLTGRWPGIDDIP